MAQPQKFPKVEPHSGQQQGEDWRAFFAHRQEADKKKAEKESSRDHQQRMQQIQNAAKGAPPGKKGAAVYVWEEENGFLLCRPAG